MEKRRYAYQFRLKLNQEQIAQFVQSAGCVRKVWNHFLAETQASFCCVKCGLTLNADENASRNILIKGFQQLNTLEQGGVVALAIAEATSFKAW